MKGKKQKHTKLVNDIVLALSKKFDGRFYVRNIGKFKLPRGKWLTFGITGQADIYGWVRINGFAHHFECEVKVPPDTLTKAQRQWKTVMEEQNVIYIIGKSPDQAIARLEEICNERQKKG